MNIEKHIDTTAVLTALRTAFALVLGNAFLMIVVSGLTWPKAVILIMMSLAGIVSASWRVFYPNPTGEKK